MNNFQRLELLLGEVALNKLKNSKVAVIGLGGVGGTCAISLARSGVGTLIIQDYDIVQESNINRQIIANYQTLGMNKVDVTEEEILKVNPNCNVIKLKERFDENSSLLNNEIDYLIDAIDSVDDKILLIKKCLKNNISFISSMGAAKKLDLKKLEVIELSKTTYDPIAKIIRKKLRDQAIYDKVWVVSSTEEPQDITALGSYMPVTSTAGLLLADYVIKQIIKE